jgi:hypothetical protein
LGGLGCSKENTCPAAAATRMRSTAASMVVTTGAEPATGTDSGATTGAATGAAAGSAAEG